MSESDDLPIGWAEVPLAEVLSPSKERVEPSESAEVPYVSLEHIESNTNRLVDRGLSSQVQSTKSVFKAGDVLYGKLRPYLNKVCIPDFDGVCSTDILVFPKAAHLESRYLMWYLSQPSVVAYANHNSSGVQLPRVSFEKLGELPFPLPPLAEQRRIIAKVEELLGHVNAARERLEKVPAILKRFRQAVLGAACSGRLTADWRRLNQNPADESATTLVSESIAQRNRQSRTAPAQPDETRYDEVPETWALATLDQLISHITSGSRGWAEYYADTGALFIRAQNINTDRLVLDDLAHVRPPESAEGRRTQVRPGDLLVTITGANVTKAAWVESGIGEAYVSQHVALARPCKTALSPFLHLWIVSPQHGRRDLLSKAYGGGKPGLNLDQLRALTIVIPPLAEQNAVVGRVAELMELADRIEASVDRARNHTAAVAHAALVQALRGELIPTEAELARQEGRDFEPAAALLERIRRKQGLASTEAGERPPRRPRVGAKR